MILIGDENNDGEDNDKKSVSLFFINKIYLLLKYWSLIFCSLAPYYTDERLSTFLLRKTGPEEALEGVLDARDREGNWEN